MTDLLKREEALVAFDLSCGYAPPHVCAPKRPSAEATVECDASLHARMRAAATIPLSELLSGDPSLLKEEAHAGVRDLASFGEWLTMKHREFMRLRMAYELGDKDKADALYEWVLAHSIVYGEVASNFRAALSQKGATTEVGAKG